MERNGTGRHNPFVGTCVGATPRTRCGVAGGRFRPDDSGEKGQGGMVRIDRVYTGGGDAGQTSVGDGSRVSKLHPRIAASGTVDEANCLLGMAAAQDPEHPLVRTLTELQQFLFDLGADLCVPLSADAERPSSFRVTEQHVAKLEALIDGFSDRLEPLNSFILPGGTPLAAALHHVRAVMRRAERDVLGLAAAEPVNPQLLVSLNRLSDLLFVMARVANDDGKSDVLWQPGASDRLGS